MKKIVTICTISAMLLVSLFAITGCKNKEENKEENTQKNEVIEETNRAEENTVNNNQNTSKSYYFAVNGKKYFAGDKISDLASSEFTLNKTGSEKELAANGYLIGGGAVLNSDNKTVFNITPFNNTKEKIKGADAFIGGFSLNRDFTISFDKDNTVKTLNWRNFTFNK